MTNASTCGKPLAEMRQRLRFHDAIFLELGNAENNKVPS